MVLEGIVCQSLLKRSDGKGRVASLEILVPTPAIRNLIRDDKIHQIYGSMQTGQEKYGMQTANQSLASLYMKGMLSLETVLGNSSNKDELQEMISRGVGVVAGAGMHRSPIPARVTGRDDEIGEIEDLKIGTISDWTADRAPNLQSEIFNLKSH